jgi:Zn-finger nucleic acid-binding protein
LLTCPVCKKSMITLEYTGVEIDYCPSCAGCWLDQGELDLILETSVKMIDLSKFRLSPKSKRRCPRCHKKMHADLFPHTQIEVDICPHDGGIWLDRGELSAIAALESEGSASQKLKDYFKELFKESD